MTLIAVGAGLRRRAMTGLGEVAKMDFAEEITRDQIAAAKDAEEKSTMGMGVGLGGMYGVKQAGAAAKKTKDAVEALRAIPGAADTAVGGLSNVTVSNGVVSGTNAVGNSIDGVEAIKALQAGAESQALASGAAAGADTVAIANAGEAALTTTKAAADAATLASQSSSLASTLGTIATPIAIGLAGAFILNKLFG